MKILFFDRLSHPPFGNTERATQQTAEVAPDGSVGSDNGLPVFALALAADAGLVVVVEVENP